MRAHARALARAYTHTSIQNFCWSGNQKEMHRESIFSGGETGTLLDAGTKWNSKETSVILFGNPDATDVLDSVQEVDWDDPRHRQNYLEDFSLSPQHTRARSHAHTKIHTQRQVTDKCTCRIQRLRGGTNQSQDHDCALDTAIARLESQILRLEAQKVGHHGATSATFLTLFLVSLSHHATV